tara:strand:- start:238 stop:1197 length:960 start_codon:yes stop_codon:yes gene_type:complete
MKKILLINLIILFILILLIEITFRVIFSYNVQGISENLINKKIDYNFNAPNLNYGKAFGAKIFTDSQGFRIKKNNVIKNNKDILFIGGSVTFGPAVKTNETFVDMLNENSKFNIRNASVFGTNLENNIKIIKNQKNLKKNVEKIFINFPLDDINSLRVSNNNNVSEEENSIKAFKRNKLIIYFNNFIRTKSATYVFLKSKIVNPQLNNYLYDLSLYENQKLLDQLELNLSELSKIVDKEKIFFYSIPYAQQVKTNCLELDKAEQILTNIFKKMNYEIFFLKNDFCNEEKPATLFLKNDPVHLSKKGHILVARILKKYLN